MSTPAPTSEIDNTAAAPVTAPTLLMTAEGGLASTRPTLEPLVTDIPRAVEVPGSGHWLMEENPDFVTTELLASSAAERRPPRPMTRT